MQHWTFAAMGMALLLASGCTSKATAENYHRISTGMTRAEVYSILGEPDQISASSLGTFSMSAESWAGPDQTLLLSFAGEKVALKTIEPTAHN